jgi:hypothetical protein
MPGSLAHTLLVASPYLGVHAMHQVQHYATPAPPHPRNILHQAQCDPGANISAMNDITFLRNRVQLDNPLSVTSMDCTSPAMLASVFGTYVLRLLDGTACNIPCNCAPYSQTRSFHCNTSRRRTLQTISSMDITALTSQDVVVFSFRVQTH